MAPTIIERVNQARAGTNLALISQVSTGWVVLCDMQYLRGYCILIADPIVPSLNNLKPRKRAEFLGDMALVGDALIEVTNAYRINYAIAGNSDPYLHAHIIPRYLTEPVEYRTQHPWSYPNSTMQATQFDYERDQELIRLINQSIQRRL